MGLNSISKLNQNSFGLDFSRILCRSSWIHRNDILSMSNWCLHGTYKHDCCLKWLYISDGSKYITLVLSRKCLKPCFFEINWHVYVLYLLFRRIFNRLKRIRNCFAVWNSLKFDQRHNFKIIWNQWIAKYLHFHFSSFKSFNYWRSNKNKGPKFSWSTNFSNM